MPEIRFPEENIRTPAYLFINNTRGRMLAETLLYRKANGTLLDSRFWSRESVDNFGRVSDCEGQLLFGYHFLQGVVHSVASGNNLGYEQFKEALLIATVKPGRNLTPDHQVLAELVARQFGAQVLGNLKYNVTPRDIHADFVMNPLVTISTIMLVNETYFKAVLHTIPKDIHPAVWHYRGELFKLLESKGINP